MAVIEAHVLDSWGVDGSRVRLTISDVSAGTEWRVIGATEGGQEWTAATGVSKGSTAWCSDPQAPLGVPASYRLEAAGQVAHTDNMVTRYLPGGVHGDPSVADGLRGEWRHDAVTDIQGRGVARFIRTPEHEVSYPVYGTTMEMAPVRPAVYAPAGAPEGAVAARTSAQSTRALDRLARSGERLIVLHNEGACTLPGCTLPLAQVVTVTGVSQSRVPNILAEDRLWSLSLTPAAMPWRWAAPWVTWRDVLRTFGTWRALADSGLTWREVASGSWLAEAPTVWPYRGLYPHENLYPQGAAA